MLILLMEEMLHKFILKLMVAVRLLQIIPMPSKLLMVQPEQETPNGSELFMRQMLQLISERTPAFQIYQVLYGVEHR
jgi:hypothetical protein